MEKTEKIWNRRFILLFITNLLVLAAFYASIPIIPAGPRLSRGPACAIVLQTAPGRKNI